MVPPSVAPSIVVRALRGRVCAVRRCCRGSRCRPEGLSPPPASVVIVAAAATGGEDEQAGRGREPPPISSGALPLSPFVGWSTLATAAPSGRQRRVLGSNASRIESPRRFRERVSTVMPATGSHEVERRSRRRTASRPRPSCRARGCRSDPGRGTTARPRQPRTPAGRARSTPRSGATRLGSSSLNRICRVADADHLGGQDELALAQREHLAADQPGQPHPAEDHQHDDQRARAAPT